MLNARSSQSLTNTELSPLLCTLNACEKKNLKDECFDLSDADVSPTTFAGTYFGTLLNIMKTCMGTGCLALPYACQQGGIILFVLGLFVIAIWNLVTMNLLIDCLSYIPLNRLERHGKKKGRNLSSKPPDCVEINSTFISDSPDQPPPGTSTLGIVAWYAFGKRGLHVLDAVIVILFLGIITAYVAAVSSFVDDTPFRINRWMNSLFAGFIMGTIAIVPDIGYLSGASCLGLFILFSAFVVIAGYGVADLTSSVTYVDGTHDYPIDNYSLVWWPSSLGGISHWYGIAVFGYGVVPLTYNFQDSMREPDRIIAVSATALTCVAISYVILGVGLYALFPHLTSDVLHELPYNGILPVVTRCAMVGTILSTGPLLIVPCADVVQGRLIFGGTADASIEGASLHSYMNEMLLVRVFVRYGVVAVCVVVAIVLPNFVEVLALVGCFCIALVSFCVPPAMHLRLAYLTHLEASRNFTRHDFLHRKPYSLGCATADVLMLLFGIVATIVSTISTLKN